MANDQTNRVPTQFTDSFSVDVIANIEQQARDIKALSTKLRSLEDRITALEQIKLKTDVVLPKVDANAVTSSVEASDNLDIFEVMQDSNKANEVASKVAQPQHDEDKKDYDAALLTLKDGKFKLAEEKFAAFIKDHAQSKLVSNAYFWYGETFFKRNIFDQATINYLKSYKHSPKGAKAADALLKLALALSEINKKQEACKVLQKLDNEFPKRAATSIKRTADARIKIGCQ